MRKQLIAAAIVAACVHRAVAADDAKTTLDSVAAALGVTNLTSIQFTGRGADFLLGQQYDGGSAWPRFNVPRYTVDIDLVTPAIRDDRVRAQGQNPPLGGGNQPIDEGRQVWLASGTFAWNQNGQNAGGGGAERDQRPALDGRMAQIWLTPQGFVKGALANNATVRTETIGSKQKTVIAFTAPTKAKFEATLNDQNLIDRIETWLHSPVLGDTMYEAVFFDYKDFGGVKFPTRIVQREGAFPVLDVNIYEVKPNGAVAIEVPANIRQARPMPFVSQPQKLAEGLWSIPVNPRDKTFAVEFRDYVVAVEAPQSEAQSLIGIEQIKKVIPNKPIRYIVNTHLHFDHSGGLRTYVAEGATILTWAGNIPYFQEVWAAPQTIDPDRLQKSGRKPTFEGIVAQRTFSDGPQEMVIYHYAGNMHSPGMLMVYFPKTKMLIEADSYNPPGNLNNPPNAMPNLVQWYALVGQMGLDVDTLLPIHDRISPMEDARKAVEAFGPMQLFPR
jgi:glyoxylase-like metal-dependent hydrolase (beta-lactamase superfamily II)